MTSMTARIGESWDLTTARILFMTIAPFPGSMPTWGLPMPPSATLPWDIWESMPLAAGPLPWRTPPFAEGAFINLRSDYGSTWQGEFIIRNCIFVPAGGRPTSASLIGGSYSGQHDFGYTCYMPERITIENLHIDDSNHPEDYQGPAIFANFNPQMTDDSYLEKFPYVRTREVILRNVTTASGKVSFEASSDNPFMFKDVKVLNDNPLLKFDSGNNICGVLIISL
jgi:hypothetical protein